MKKFSLGFAVFGILCFFPKKSVDFREPIWYIISTEREVTQMKYVVLADGKYLNCFASYTEACELRDRLIAKGWQGVTVETAE